METIRRNKRTYCSPRSKIPGNQSDNNSNTVCHKDNQTNNDSSTCKKQNRNVTTSSNNSKSTNNKIQDYAKILSEIPEKITREKNQDHIFFTSANTQIFQTKVAYFPGKNLKDLRKVLKSNKIENQVFDRPRTNTCIIPRRSYLSSKEKTFGKHLTGPKKKTKKMKAIQNPLNTIDEVNETDKSKECLEKENELKESSSIVMSYTDVGENTKLVPKNDFKYKTPDTVYGHKACVSYMFQEGETSSSKSCITKESPEEVEKIDVKGVHQIRNMFEQMSQNVPEKKESRLPKMTTLPFNPVHFEHTISCEECRRILKDLIENENISTRDLKLAMTEIPHNAARRIVDSLVQEICENVTNRSNMSVKIETKKTTTISKVAYRKNRRICRKRRSDLQDLEYKNFFLLALALSIVLYCFYCRLNEKKS